jgi:predicted RNA polymerase sigma factor
MIARGLTALTRGETLNAANAAPAGPYTLQASIAAQHARALTADATDWNQIVALYETLAATAPSPIVELNRAVAVAMAQGPAAGLEILNTLTTESALQNYHLLPSVRADLLQKLGRLEEARAEFSRASTLTRNARERDLLRARANACTNGSPPH